MRCHEIEELLTDYVEDDLAEARRSKVELHLEGCAACRAELEREREIVRQARRWSRDVEPERDLWPGIQAAIAESDPEAAPTVVRGPWLTPARIALAAAAALVVAVTLIVARPGGGPVDTLAGDANDAGLAEPALDDRALDDSTEATSWQLASERARAESGLMHVREDLLRAIHTRRDELDPEIQEMVDQNLAIIDRAIGEIYSALEEDPDNRVLEQLLADTYQREAEFLKQINTL